MTLTQRKVLTCRLPFTIFASTRSAASLPTSLYNLLLSVLTPLPFEIGNKRNGAAKLLLCRNRKQKSPFQCTHNFPPLRQNLRVVRVRPNPRHLHQLRRRMDFIGARDYYVQKIKQRTSHLVKMRHRIHLPCSMRQRLHVTLELEDNVQFLQARMPNISFYMQSYRFMLNDSFSTCCHCTGFPRLLPKFKRYSRLLQSTESRVAKVMIESLPSRHTTLFSSDEDDSRLLIMTTDSGMKSPNLSASFHVLPSYHFENKFQN